MADITIYPPNQQAITHKSVLNLKVENGVADFYVQSTVNATNRIRTNLPFVVYGV